MTERLIANRMKDVPKSFIREILKVANQPNVISFAGGLPNADLFPNEALREAAMQVFTNNSVFQYGASEGLPELRDYIAQRYKEKDGLEIDPSRILITSGSQQGLDLLGKTFLNEEDGVIIEEPGYLGAIQAFASYRASFTSVPLQGDGLDMELLEKELVHKHKLIYTVPAFQNPSGISYSEEKIVAISNILRGKDILMIEDTPYRDINFESEKKKDFFYRYIPEQTIILGSFSKTCVPGMRLGWMVIPEAFYDRILIAKQATDLHTNITSQYILLHYLKHNDIERHIAKINKQYSFQYNTMLQELDKYFPKEGKFTRPGGGMFIWARLPGGLSAYDLFKLAIERGVAFVPGDPFYAQKKEGISTLRLNFTNSKEEELKKGVQILSSCIEELLVLEPAF